MMPIFGNERLVSLKVAVTMHAVLKSVVVIALVVRPWSMADSVDAPSHYKIIDARLC